MSNFGKGFTLKVFGKQSIEITNKISKNKLKKQHKHEKKQENIDLGITDIEFESIMADNEIDNKNISDKIYFYKIPEISDVTNYVKELLNKKILGQELLNYIELNNNSLNGVELLNGLLNHNFEITDITWFDLNKYGLVLKKLFESKIDDQLIGLLMIQNYCSKYNFPKIEYRNKSIYLLKILFQLFFTYDIFDEETYWKLQDYNDNNDNIDNNTKKLLLIQTAEFFILLKTVFTDEDYENVNENDHVNTKVNTNLQISKFNEECDEDSHVEYDKVPEEQDFNLDDI